jgi:hypothetical protein
VSGSGGRSDRPSLTLEELQARAATRTRQAEYESETETILRDALREYNDRDIASIRQHLDTIGSAISQLLDEGSVDLLFGGSVAKRTYVNGLSDVDMLACLNDTSLEGKSPAEVLDYFKSVLKQRLPRTEIKVGDLAVTVKFSDGHEIQILPAIRTAQGFRIANPDTGSWSTVVAPHRFARKLTTINQQLGGKVVPVIKLAKAINSSLPKPLRLSGYHIESLAIEAFANYSGQRTYREMTRHYWQFARTQVLRPIVDSTGQSRHVDDYLGSANSVARKRVSHAIGRMVAGIDTADTMRSTDVWQEMLEV